jgi:hypothetical protein
MINNPTEDEWYAASREEMQAIANPDSFIGGLIRPHAALLSLPYLSWN